MFIFVQYSFTDVRSFNDESKNLINSDNWEFPKAYINFARNLGECVDRKPLEVKGLVSETHLFSSKNGIKFPKSTSNKSVKIINRYNHFFFDGVALSKFEFIFKVWDPKANVLKKKKIIKESIINESIQRILDLNLKILNLETKKFEQKQFKSIRDNLKKIFIGATTIKSKINFQQQVHFINSNQIQIIVSLEPDEQLEFLSKRENRISEGCYNYSLKKNKILITSYGSSVKRSEIKEREEKNRKIRIVNSRLFLEKENIHSIFFFINSSILKIEPKENPYLENVENRFSDRIQEYLTKKISKISNWEQIKDSEIPLEEIYYNELEILKEKILSFNFRPSVERKVINFIKNEFNINNLEVMENKYKIDRSQIGQVGENNTAHNTTFNQENSPSIKSELSDDDVNALKSELTRLKKELEEKEKTDVTRKAIETVSDAQKAVEENNKPKILEYLKSGGQWLLDFAKEVGVEITAKLIEDQIGIKS